MGGRDARLGSDLTAGSWNPAALGWMDEGAVAITHAGLDNGSLQEWLGTGGRLGRSGTRWSLSGLYQGDGTLDGRDARTTRPAPSRRRASRWAHTWRSRSDR